MTDFSAIAVSWSLLLKLTQNKAQGKKKLQKSLYHSKSNFKVPMSEIVWLVNYTLLNMPTALSKYLCSPAKEGRLLTCFLTLTCSASKVVGKVRTFRDDSDGDGIMWALNGSPLLHEALQKAMKAVQPREMTGERGARLTNEYHSSHPTIACQASSHCWAASPSPWNLLWAEFIFLKTNLSLGKF